METISITCIYTEQIIYYLFVVMPTDKNIK